MKRDVTFDIMRGLAIVIMVFANSMGNMLKEPHPYWLRFVASIAAPMFILISGTMVALTLDKKNYDFKYFLYRGAFIVGCGVFLEVIIWATYPFTIFEVLYLIGFSIPLTYLFLKVSNEILRWLIIIAIIAVTPYLQATFGYTEYPTEYGIPGKLYLEIENQTSILNHYFVDGWFPLFPWLAFAFIGANLYFWRKKYAEFHLGIKTTIIGALMVCAGFVIWQIFPPELITRDGYSEFFYPPTTGFIMWAIGVILLIFVFTDKTAKNSVWKPFIMFGSAPLFVYLFHYAVLASVFVPFFEDEEAQMLNLSRFVVVYVGFMMFLFAATYLFLRWKKSLTSKKA